MNTTTNAASLTERLRLARRKVWEARIKVEEEWGKVRTSLFVLKSADDSWDDLWHSCHKAAQANFDSAVKEEARTLAAYYAVLNALKAQDRSLIAGSDAQIPSPDAPVPLAPDKVEAISQETRNKISEHFKEVDEADFNPEQTQNLVLGYMTIVYEHLRKLDKQPTLEMLLRIVVLTQPIQAGAVGDTRQTTGLLKDIQVSTQKAALAILKQARRAFESSPTVANFNAKMWIMGLAQGRVDPDQVDDTDERIQKAHRSAQQARLKPAKGPYTAKPGDTLPFVARLHYGDPGYWDILFIYNRKKLKRAHPDQVIAGMQLHIP